MAEQACVLILVLPLFAAIGVTLLGYWRERYCLPVALVGLGGSLISAVVTLVQVVEGGEIRYFLGGWEEPRGIGIEFGIDHLNALVMVLIATVGLLTAIYSSRRVTEETPTKVPQFYTLYLLLVTGLMGMTITADAFNLYVLLEVASLTSYALIAMGNSRRAAHAAFNYVIMGTIGASFYLLGVGYLYIKTGSLNMEDIRAILVEKGLHGSQSIHIAFVLILLGVWIKMAFFPLHGWLPNAYTFSPSSAGCLLAPLMTKVSVYVMFRMMLSVFGLDYILAGVEWTQVIVWMACIAIVAGSLLALSQTELKKMLSFLIVAEAGYMIGGAWLTNHYGMVGAFYHLLSDGAMTSCLFLAASILYYRTGTHEISQLRGMFRRMPVTMTAFTVGALAMIGVPPTCGFFSKWYLIRGGLEAGQHVFVVALLFSSLINAVLFFRVLEVAFFRIPEAEAENGEASHDAPEVKLEEAPATMLAPLLVAAASLVLLGIYNADVVEMIAASINQLTQNGGSL